MQYYLFPFGKVEKNSRIVLYAAGNIGKIYYKQICDTGFCKVVLWVDKKPNGKTVLEPEVIKALSANDYDLVVIAIKNGEAAAPVKTFLLKCGVPENKIFYESPTTATNCDYIMPSKLNLVDFLSDEDIIQDALTAFFYESDGKIIYFSALIDEMKKTAEEDPCMRELIHQRALKAVENLSIQPEAKIVLLRILFEAECFSPELTRQLVKLIGMIKGNTHQKYWLMLDLSYMWLFYPDILYDGFFVDKKRLMRDFAEELQMVWVSLKYERKANRNICVLVPDLHAGTASDCVAQVVSPIVRELDRRGYTIHMIEMGTFNWDSGANFLSPSHVCKYHLVCSRDKLLQYYPDSINLHYTSAAMMRERQQEILDLVCKINPYCIIDATDDCSAISYYYSKNYPTIYFPLRKQGFSSSFFHKVIIMSKDVKIHAPITPEQVLSTSLYREYNPPKRVFKREDYGFSENDILVVTASNRLSYDLSQKLIDQFYSALSNEARIKWLCVGSNEPSYLQERYSDLIGKQVFLWGYEEDLPGLYGICDIYLNPERVGGGTTIAWAMQQGLAVASPMGASAGVSHIGKKLSVETEADLVPYVVEMAKNPEVLRRNRETMREIAAEWSIETYVDKLVEGMDELAEEFAV